MRIIAGEKRGFPLISPAGRDTRPTLGRVRESVFSILGSVVIDARVIDLYAGTGALGLEALSRGARHCTFVEKSRGAVEALRKNIAKLCYESKCSVVPADAIKSLTAPLVEQADIVFLDPPYGLDAANRTASTVLTRNCSSAARKNTFLQSPIQVTDC